jgi:sec-independent protein translocase protein TatC
MLINILQKLFKLREKRPSGDDPDKELVKPFLEHMEDLRWTVIKCLAVLVISMIAGLVNRHELMTLLRYPLVIADPEGRMVEIIRADNPIDSFMISFKMAFYMGIVVSLPILLYFIADFVLPALTKKEKRVLIPGFLVGILFFLAGAYLSFTYITPHTLKFFWDDTNSMDMIPLWTWRHYISFVTWLTMGFGLMCEVPLLVILLASFRIVNFKFLTATRSYAIVIILVLAAIVSPTPDPITFLAIGTPIIIMYEMCIWIVWLLEFKRRKREREAAVDELVN